MAEPNPPTTHDAPSLLCPACGFDLRATASDRCGECGLPFDRALLTVSGIPWAHRRRIGRFRAYFKTLWQFTLDRKSLRYEAAKPQEIADGRAFRRVTAGVVAAALLAVFMAALCSHYEIALLAIQYDDWYRDTRVGMELDHRLWDLAVPWSAGATLAPVLPLCLVLLAFWLTGAQRFIFRVPSSLGQHRERAIALSHYITAPMAFLVPALAFGIILGLITQEPDEDSIVPKAILVGLGLASFALFALAILFTLLRTAQWLCRTRHCSAGGALLGLAELLGLWLLGAIVLIGLFPWCIGFVWIAIDSLR